MSNEISRKILEEMIDLSVEVIQWLESVRLPLSIKDQLTRSITSIGANYSEAQDAGSKKDFLNKIYIAKKEAFETKYWLRLAEQLLNLPGKEDLEDLLEQTQRYLMMLQKIITTTKEAKS